MTKARQKKSEPAATWEEIGVLVPWEANPRINEHAVQEVAESIKRFGFSAPIVARREDRMVIAGHTRLKAAHSLGLDKVPVRYLDLDPTDAKLLALADNRIAEVADWDQEGLSEVFRSLDEEGIDLSAAGFSSDELEKLLAPLDYEARSGEELDAESFSAFDHKCPRCSFEWDDA